MNVIPITPTGMGKWHTCPRQYRASYITKETQYTETVHTRFGIYVHSAIEHYLKGDRALPRDLEFLMPILDTVNSFTGLKLVETEVCIDRNMQRVAWRDKTVWQRAKADMILVDKARSRAIVIDWKTSKGKTPNELARFGDDSALIQQRILAICTAITHEVNEVVTCFVYPYKPVVGVVTEVYHPADAKQMGLHYMMCAEFEQAQKRGVYPPKPNALCKAWCDVRTCAHNGRLPDEVKAYLNLATGDVPLAELERVFGVVKLRER